MNEFSLSGIPFDVESDELDVQFVKIFDGAQNERKFIFGINVYTEALLKVHKVNAIIDEFYEETHFQGVQVIGLEKFMSLANQVEIASGNPLVICTSGGRPVSAMSRLRKFNVDCIHYFNYRLITTFDLPEIFMNENFRYEYKSNFDEFKKVYEKLEDIESKNLFDQIVRFRYTNQLAEISNLRENQENQYFEDFLDFVKPPCFLDIGSFDGKTTLKFIENFPTFHSVIAFEPELTNYLVCKRNLADVRYKDKISIFNVGLGNSPGNYEILGSASVAQVNFEHEKERASQVNMVTSEATILRLDDLRLTNRNLFPENLQYFMKLDIEGMELDAIRGAREFIRALNVSIAVCVYHKPDHFWKIANELFEIKSDYRIYMRHYTESIYETVMYFVP
jgi:FkbM family methyltransferase